MKSRVPIVLSMLALSMLALACDSRTTEEPKADLAQREAQAEAQPQPEPASPPTRELAELQRELTNHENQLRQLGVPILATAAAPPTDGLAEETVANEATVDTKTTSGSGGRGVAPAKQYRDPTKKKSNTRKDEDAGKSGGAAPGGSAPVSPKPSPSPDPDATIAGGGDKAESEQAKSVQGQPSDRPNVQAEERCPLICTLADSTCELTDEICELADRHVDDDTYSLACERATNDCKQAREACLECLG